MLPDRLGEQSGQKCRYRRVLCLFKAVVLLMVRQPFIARCVKTSVSKERGGPLAAGLKRGFAKHHFGIQGREIGAKSQLRLPSGLIPTFGTHGFVQR